MKPMIMTMCALLVVTALAGCAVDGNKDAASQGQQASGKTGEVTPLKGPGVKEIVPKVTGTWDDKKWQRCIEFHGHECGGLAIGFRAAQAAIEKMNLTSSEGERIVCVTGCNTCPADAIQVVLSCTFGKGNFIYHETGKFVFNFFNPKTGESLRISRKTSGQKAVEEKRFDEEYVLKAPLDELFEFNKPTESACEAMRSYVRKGNSVACEMCGEQTREDRIQLQDGKKVCLECLKTK